MILTVGSLFFNTCRFNFLSMLLFSKIVLSPAIKNTVIFHAMYQSPHPSDQIE